jgi:hypothetical protein
MMDLADAKLLAEHSRTLYELRDALLWAITEIDLLKEEKADLLSRAEKAEAERDAAYQKGQEDMRERAGETIDCKADDLTRAGAFGPASGFRAAASDIRALPIKEAALSAKEGKK